MSDPLKIARERKAKLLGELQTLGRFIDQATQLQRTGKLTGSTQGPAAPPAITSNGTREEPTGRDATATHPKKPSPITVEPLSKPAGEHRPISSHKAAHQPTLQAGAPDLDGAASDPNAPVQAPVTPPADSFLFAQDPDPREIAMKA
jgi:hypothetical protein